MSQACSSSALAIFSPRFRCDASPAPPWKRPYRARLKKRTSAGTVVGATVACRGGSRCCSGERTAGGGGALHGLLLLGGNVLHVLRPLLGRFLQVGHRLTACLLRRLGDLAHRIGGLLGDRLRGFTDLLHRTRLGAGGRERHGGQEADAEGDGARCERAALDALH